jgi:hypothetical protein
MNPVPHYQVKPITNTSQRDQSSDELQAAVRRSIREHGGEPSSRQVDELLDERYELRPGRRKRAP